MSTPTGKEFFYIRDLDRLREKLARAERDRTVMGRAWHSLRHRAKTAPDTHPWFVPFVALITGDQADIASAKRQILNYVATFDAQQFGMGIHFHFWCFAFPHARWGLFFKWLDILGVWTDAERKKIIEALAVWQLTNFFSGMRMKPEPECVDNQSLSLCFSNALFGRLFGETPEVGALARRVAKDGLRRLPDMLGGFPPSGYSGEGSTYMDGVVGPAIPYVVELLEAEHGGDWFNRALPPCGGSAASVVRMIAREWMPNGLLLPWDHYGYSFPMRSCIAYGAYRTGESFYFDLLEKAAHWGYDSSVGWGFDDLIWTLVWWPEERPKSTGKLFSSWAEPEVGGALVSDRGDLYLMQMWDHSTPRTPIREHANPNSLILAAYGSPLMTDGVATKECHDFDYDDTWLNRTGMNFNAVRSNYGVGCAGSHSVLLVDGWEGMRIDQAEKQAALLEFDAAARVLAADVTPIYREKWADTICVRRRSRICEERFWLIEDLAAFRDEHDVTSRWLFRPEVVATNPGVVVETAEGVRVHLLPLLGPEVKDVKPIRDYPDRLDFESRQVDFHQKGAVCRWLWLAFPSETRKVHEDVTGDWRAAADVQARWTLEQAGAALEKEGLNVPVEMPPYMLTNAPVAGVWWYRKKLTLPPQGGKAWLRLPSGLYEPRIWFNGRELDLKRQWKLAQLMPLDVEIPADAGREVDVVFRTEVGVEQYSKKGIACFHGRASVMVPVEPATVTASYRDGMVRVSSGTSVWNVPHELMPVEAGV